jgi:hypothetical protein
MHTGWERGVPISKKLNPLCKTFSREQLPADVLLREVLVLDVGEAVARPGTGDLHWREEEGSRRLPLLLELIRNEYLEEKGAFTYSTRIFLALFFTFLLFRLDFVCKVDN